MVSPRQPWFAVPIALLCACTATTPESSARAAQQDGGTVRVAPVRTGGASGIELQRAIARAAAGGPTHIALAPGEYVLEPTAYTDPSCGNCEQATDTVPATLGVRIAGRGVQLTGAHADSVVIRTRAGYGLLFEDCDSCVLRGVTVTDGVRDPDGRATDAAVVVRRARVLIEDCVIRDNIGDSAMVTKTVVGIIGIAGREGSHVTVRNCRIVRNSWDGIALYRAARADLRDNVVDGVDKASGARVGGGRGVGIGLTWDARAVVERNLVRRYWKGIGAFVNADADIRENIIEDLLTWGIALWGPNGGTPAARIERNVVYRTGACGIMLDRPAGGAAPGSVRDNVVMRTGQNSRYDNGEPYCWQRPVARPSVPPELTESGTLLAANRQPREAGGAPPPLPELTSDELIRRARPLLARLAHQPALRGALLFREIGVAAREPRRWERVLAAEDARARTPAQLDTLLAATRADDVALRAQAIRALGRLERAELVPSITPLLQDSAPRVRAEAANALGQALFRGDSSATATEARARSAQLLLDGLRRHAADPVTAGAMAETLGRIQYHDRALARTIAAQLVTLLGGSAEARLGAVRGLYFLSRQQPVRGALDSSAIAALRGVAVAGRNAAAPADVLAARSRGLALALLAAASGTDERTLESALADPSPQVGREAAAAAAAVADTAAVRRILARGLADAAATVQYEALRVYSRRLAQARGCGPVVDAARAADDHVALLGLDLLGTVCRLPGHAPLLDSVAAALPSGMTGGWHRAAHALVSLAGVDAARARARLQASATHPSFFVRGYAARAAGVLRDESLLRRLALDAHPNVRTAAVQGLASFAGRAADSVYIAQLTQEDSELLMAAAAALDRSERSDAARHLLDALDRVTAQRRETSRDARRALLERAGALGSAALAERVRPYLRDFDPAIAAQAAGVLGAWSAAGGEPRPEPLPALPLPSYEEVEALARAIVVIELADGGAIELRLLPFDAPTNAARFARLARAGFYDGLTFHRVAPNFVLQGGSPNANEYSGDGPFTRDELGLAGNWRGTAGLSTRGRDTGDAQLFINLIDNVRLDHDYTVFAEITSGMDVVDRIQEGAVIRRIVVRDG